MPPSLCPCWGLEVVIVSFHSVGVFSLSLMLVAFSPLSICLSPPLTLSSFIINMIGLVMICRNVSHYGCVVFIWGRREYLKDCSHMLKHPVREWNQSGWCEHVHIDKIFVNGFVRNASEQPPKYWICLVQLWQIQTDCPHVWWMQCTERCIFNDIQ